MIELGCNCGKSRAVQPAGMSTVRRETIYQVLNNSTIISEHGTLPEARKAATEVGGRVKVTTKMVN